ncbi:MAG TPA: hypothetical protein VJK02_09035, partial [Anaerolineales bacterium]|nr:hypothetical protein [Anaerolineales bacterium]
FCPPATKIARVACRLFGHSIFRETSEMIYCLRCWRIGWVIERPRKLMGYPRRFVNERPDPTSDPPTHRSLREETKQ